jgi:hypothetical protein
MKEREQGSRSEQFVKSLEPEYSSEEQEQPLIRDDRVHAHRTSSPRHHVVHPLRSRFEKLSALFLLVLLLFVFFIAASAQASPFIVLVSFSPVLFTIIFSLILFEAHLNNRYALWVVPLFLVFLFHIIVSSSGGLFAHIEVEVLSAVNMLASYVYIITMFFVMGKPSHQPEQRIIVQAPPAPLVQDLPRFIASIEDKSKALNFVIGRVYNAYHGGTKPLRDKVNMKQEWYDQFSALPQDPDEIDFPALLALIDMIERRLKRLELSEQEVFGAAHLQFKNLIRTKNGSDRVIDVLDRNDKDPVTSYVEGALDFCGKVRELARLRQAPEVKNQYQGGDDENASAPRSSKHSSNLKK